MTDTPTSPVSLLGRYNPGDIVEIKARIVDQEILPSPYFKQACIFYYARDFTVITKGSGKHKSVYEETSEVLYSENFLTLKDRTGSVKVDLKDFEYKEFCKYKKKLVYGESTLFRIFGFGSSSQRFREEYVLPPTSQMIYVLGTFNRNLEEEFITGNENDKAKCVFSTKSEEKILSETWIRLTTCFIIWIALSIFVYHIF
ncbi:MAG: hypothetical protein PHF29_04015 [Candidatus Riflebacteria bacterium]|nr:hypothetical protein [Candidatus Riflebacteria bacterium]